MAVKGIHNETIKKTCIVCPIGCSLEIVENIDAEFGYTVSGNQCPRGEKYAIKEMTNPMRVVTSTVKIKNKENIMVPVKTTDGIPKEKVIDFMEDINKISVDIPIKKGEILIENIYGTGVDLVVTRDIN